MSLSDSLPASSSTAKETVNKLSHSDSELISDDIASRASCCTTPWSGSFLLPNNEIFADSAKRKFIDKRGQEVREVAKALTKAGKHRILKAKKVITLDDEHPDATVLASVGRFYSFVGKDLSDNLQELVLSDHTTTELLDLSDYYVVPGFIEPHMHPLMFAHANKHIDLTPAEVGGTRAGALERLKLQAAGRRSVIGWGYDAEMMDDPAPLTMEELDLIASDRPVIVVHTSMHICYANAFLFEKAGITKDTPDPHGAHFVRKNGQLTGEAQEMHACLPLLAALPSLTYDQLLELAKEGMEELARRGYTSITDAMAGTASVGQDFHIYQDLTASNKFPIRITAMPAANLGHWPLHTGFGNFRLRIGPKKYVLDGSVQGHTAWVRDGYFDQPEVHGVPQYSMGDLKKAFLADHLHGFQLAIHTNGDGAIEQALDALQCVLEAHPRPDHRHRLEHCQMPTVDQLQRMADLGICANFFVNHCWYWGDYHVSHTMGPKRAATISPLATATKLGVRWSIHSDGPVTRPDPLFGMWASVNRLTQSGKVLGPDERVSALEALKAVTIDAAYLSFEEHMKGSISVGKLADATVLNRNPLEVDPLEIRGIKVIGTIVGGIFHATEHYKPVKNPTFTEEAIAQRIASSAASSAASSSSLPAAVPSFSSPSEFLQIVRSQSSAAVYSEFLSLLKQFHSDSIDSSKLSDKVEALFSSSPHLFVGFKQFN